MTEFTLRTDYQVLGSQWETTLLTSDNIYFVGRAGLYEDSRKTAISNYKLVKNGAKTLAEMIEYGLAIDPTKKRKCDIVFKEIKKGITVTPMTYKEYYELREWTIKEENLPLSNVDGYMIIHHNVPSGALGYRREFGGSVSWIAKYKADNDSYESSDVHNVINPNENLAQP